MALADEAALVSMFCQAVEGSGDRTEEGSDRDRWDESSTMVF